MSFRELRNFTEMLRALGYPRLISIENFRTPNFKLVAEILAWLLKRYDPDNDLAMVLDTEQDRVIFIKQAALFLVQKARIKVNPKKLYQADGYAVQELLKVTTVLYSAVQHNQFSLAEDYDDNVNISTVSSSINSKLNELRVSRQLAAEIPEKGASLYDLLSKEVDLREQRSTALARPLELKDVEKSLRASIKAVEEEIRQSMHNLSNISSDEASLDSKIEKKRTELERQQKRLAQLQVVRPAYMDEYEKLENQLKDLYAVYVMKYRNLSYLEHIQGNYDKAEQERTMEAESSLRKMAEKMREEEREKQEAAIMLDTGMNDDDQDYFEEEAGVKKPRVYGNITGAGLSDEEEDEEEDDSLLSDEDDDVMGGQGETALTNLSRKPKPLPNDEDNLSGLSDDDDDDEGLVMQTGGAGQKPVQTSNNGADVQPDVDSDDDF